MHEEELSQDPGNTFETHLIIIKPQEEQNVKEKIQDKNSGRVFVSDIEQ